MKNTIEKIEREMIEECKLELIKMIETIDNYTAINRLNVLVKSYIKEKIQPDTVQSN